MFSAVTTARLADAATLANTSPGLRGGRQLPDRLDAADDGPSPLPAILPDWGFEEDPSSATQRSIRKLRAVLAGIWQDAAALDVAAALEGINGLLATAGTVHLELAEDATARTPSVLAAGQAGDTAERALSVALALALTDVALAGELTRLRTCTGEDCTNAFVDLTRNRSKQFCDEANCANRAHVKAYRARRAAEAEEADGAKGTADPTGTGDTVSAEGHQSTVSIQPSQKHVALRGAASRPLRTLKRLKTA